MTYEAEKLSRLLEIPVFYNLLGILVFCVCGILTWFLLVLWSKN